MWFNLRHYVVDGRWKTTNNQNDRRTTKSLQVRKNTIFCQCYKFLIGVWKSLTLLLVENIHWVHKPFKTRNVTLSKMENGKLSVIWITYIKNNVCKMLIGRTWKHALCSNVLLYKTCHANMGYACKYKTLVVIKAGGSCPIGTPRLRDTIRQVTSGLTVAQRNIAIWRV